MKKNLLIVFMCVLMVFLAVSCDEPKHEHSYSQKHDETNHWMECSCGDKKDVAKHKFEVDGEKDTPVKKCDICGYSEKIDDAVLVSTAKELAEAVEKEGIKTVYLAAGIEIEGPFSFSKDLTLDLNGKKLSLKQDDEGSVGLWVGDFSNTEKINVTIKNGTIEADLTKDDDDVWDYYLIAVWKENILTLENIKYNSKTDSSYEALLLVSTEGGSYVEGESLSPTLNIIDSDITTSSKFGVYIPQERHYTNFATLSIENSNITNNATEGVAVYVDNAKVVVKGSFDISKVDSVCCSIKRSDSTVYYGTLETAVYDVKEGETITLLEDVDLTNYKSSLSEAGIEIPAYDFIFAKDVTLDLNGKTITSNNYGVVWEGDGLLIKNGKFVCAKGGSYALFIGNGHCDEGTANDYDYSEQGENSETEYYKFWNATVDDITCVGGINVFFHKLTVKSTVCTEAAGTNYYALWADILGRITVEGGTFTSPSNLGGSVLHTNSTEGAKGSLYIKGGTFKAEEGVSLFATGANIKISGGTFSADPSSYLEEGYKATGENGVWTVSVSPEE